ncbi:DUF397 domain-containing protein [Streptomyces tateyamensis]|uniref:DUF397 domain-containing protein n=2 Tax=Streptomyces tateyamensis TaxID=565073 RepID=A0A2V4NUG7_9ACTN|nr:DUF397 domain-containing protein [Streptomyces tateyamensis]
MSRLVWVKSSYSSEEGGQCVEVALSAGAIRVRDSKDRTGPVLSFDDADWVAFLGFAVTQAG